MLKKRLKGQLLLVLFIVLLASILVTVYAASWDVNSQNDFNEGIYNRTAFFVDAVKLNSSVTGTYSSKVFDASRLSEWNSISWNADLPVVNHVMLLKPELAKDAQGNDDITKKVEELDHKFTSKMVEVQKWNNSLPSGAGVDSVVGYCYLNPHIFLPWIGKKNLKIKIGFQVSRDNGSNWDPEVCVQDVVKNSKKNSKFSCDLKKNSGVDTVDEVNNLWLRCTFPTSHHYAVDFVQLKVNYSIIHSNLSLRVRSCDDSSCSGENFISVPFVSPQNLTVADNRFFQFRFDFSTDDISYSPGLYDVSVDYSVLNNIPEVTLLSPKNSSLVNKVILKAVVFDSDDNFMDADFFVDGVLVHSEKDVSNNSVLSYSWTSASDGLHNWTVVVSDGTANSTREYHYFTVDTVDPFIEYNSNAQSSGNQSLASIFVNVSVFDDNLDSVLLFWNGVPEDFQFSDGNNYWSDKAGLSDGTYSFYAWVNDSAGNVNQTSS
ncbi:hypothetical protein DRJ25_02860, partial [Candidatus Woesearchaeota archaeon]